MYTHTHTQSGAHTHTQQYALFHMYTATHTHSYAANEQAAFSLGISLPIYFFRSTFTTSLHPSSPSSCTPMTASPPRGLDVWRVSLTHTQTGKLRTQAHAHLHANDAQNDKTPFLPKTSQHKRNEIVMKYMLCSLSHSHTHLWSEVVLSQWIY